MYLWPTAECAISFVRHNLYWKYDKSSISWLGWLEIHKLKKRRNDFEATKGKFQAASVRDKVVPAITIRGKIEVLLRVAS